MGAVLILVPIFVFITFESIHRQKESTTRLLVEKGAALIRSFEAGTRTGMMGMRGGGFQVQRLLTETAQQPDIVYLLVTEEDGTILAHSDISRLGSTYGSGLDLGKVAQNHNVSWRQVTLPGGEPVFEVFRQFSPTRGQTRLQRRRMTVQEWWQHHLNPEGPRGDVRQVIFVGLDMQAVEAARRQDIRHTVIMAAILLLIGFAGIVSLFLAQAYRTTRLSLSRVQAFSDNLVAHMPIGLLAVDADGRIASLNQVAESTLELQSDGSLGRKPDEILPEALLEVLGELREGPGLLDEEIEFPLASGKVIPLEVIATALQDDQGNRMGDVLLFRDLSEIRQLQDEISRNQRLAAIGRLAAGVAHEIRNPLSSIKGFATYFKERYRQVPEDQKTADIMIQEVDRLNRVIGQLLEFARPLSLRKEPTSFPGLIQSSLRMIEREARERAVALRFDPLPEPGPVLLDPDKMKQVLMNLYLNAMEAMPEGGTLSVEAVEDRAAGTLLLFVTDTGQGVEEEHLAHIFDPFFTTKSSGTGLGLAIVHKIVESHGGEIRVDSRVGRGTRVSVVLPLIPAEKEARTA